MEGLLSSGPTLSKKYIGLRICNFDSRKVKHFSAKNCFLGLRDLLLISQGPNQQEHPAGFTGGVCRVNVPGCGCWQVIGDTFFSFLKFFMGAYICTH